MFGPQDKIVVKKESGRGLCDIAVNRVVGIELKKDLKSKAQIDRLTGQIRRYMKDYDVILVVLVGNTNSDAREDLEEAIQDINYAGSPIGGQGPRVDVIEITATEEEPVESERSLWQL